MYTQFLLVLVEAWRTRQDWTRSVRYRRRLRSVWRKQLNSYPHVIPLRSILLESSRHCKATTSFLCVFTDAKCSRLMGILLMNKRHGTMNEAKELIRVVCGEHQFFYLGLSFSHPRDSTNCAYMLYIYDFDFYLRLSGRLQIILAFWAENFLHCDIGSASPLQGFSYF